ncbi:MAG TPA: hypothetical protein VLC93_04705 [Myxococcota bacterium]|nr:hypothetical protein [Myxococcota bacterium]
MSLALALTSLVLSQAYRPTTPVEIYVAPIVAPTNILGMGGAAQALATGSGAMLMNPAAMAVRYDYNGGNWFDWDFSLDYLVSAGDTDIENSGFDRGDESVQLLEASLGFNFGRLGVGLSFDSQETRFCGRGFVCDVNSRLRINTVLGALSASYAFLDGEVTAGASIIVPSASFQQGDDQDSPRFSGSAIALGVVVRPHGQPLRLGLSTRLRTDATRDGGGDNAQVGENYIPDALEAPWQIAGGVAWSFGDKPLNLRNSFGDSRLINEELDQLRRSYITVAADLVVIGPGGGATGRGAWIAREEQTAGRAASLSLHVGAESEFWPNQMRGRIGSYYEPSRFDAADGRIHGTIGFDFRLLELIWVWRLSGVFDYARDYRNLGVSIGFWH